MSAVAASPGDVPGKREGRVRSFFGKLGRAVKAAARKAAQVISRGAQSLGHGTVIAIRKVAGGASFVLTKTVEIAVGLVIAVLASAVGLVFLVAGLLAYAIFWLLTSVSAGATWLVDGSLWIFKAQPGLTFAELRTEREAARQRGFAKLMARLQDDAHPETPRFFGDDGEPLLDPEDEVQVGWTGIPESAPGKTPVAREFYHSNDVFVEDPDPGENPPTSEEMLRIFYDRGELEAFKEMVEARQFEEVKGFDEEKRQYQTDLRDKILKADKTLLDYNWSLHADELDELEVLFAEWATSDYGREISSYFKGRYEAIRLYKKDKNYLAHKGRAQALIYAELRRHQAEYSLPIVKVGLLKQLEEIEQYIGVTDANKVS